MTTDTDPLRLRDLNGLHLTIDPVWTDRSTGQRFPARFGEYELTPEDAATAARWLAPEIFTAARDSVDQVIAILDRTRRQHNCADPGCDLSSGLDRSVELLLGLQVTQLGGSE